MDKIEKVLNSKLQHGKHSDRVYLMSTTENDIDDIIKKLDSIASDNNYSKIVAKAPSYKKVQFIENGYVEEAYIPKYYKDMSDACILSKFLNKEREIIKNRELINDVINLAVYKDSDVRKINTNYSIKKLEIKDTLVMADIYQKVFKTYPFPIHDIDYLKETMRDNVEYYGVFVKEKLVALSSCEMDLYNLNVEMTDFACLDEYRGNNLAYYLLEYMERKMLDKNIKTFYTIARAVSYGMNITFSKLKYNYAGTLINNTNISGGLESMNIWYKNV